MGKRWSHRRISKAIALISYWKLDYYKWLYRNEEDVLLKLQRRRDELLMRGPFPTSSKDAINSFLSSEIWIDIENKK